MLTDELLKAIENNTVSHAYLFTNEKLAFEFAEKLGAKQVDFSLVEPQEGKMHILTEDIEKLQEELKYKSYGERRVVLINKADSMQAVAQNKLLKTLEEPLGNTAIILYAERRDALLKTILSRCTEIAGCDEAPDLDPDAVRIAEEFWKKKQQGAQFFELKAVLNEILDDKESSREMALSFLDALENLLREDLIQSLDSNRLGGAIKLTEEARNNIRSSFSVAYALKALALNI